MQHAESLFGLAADFRLGQHYHNRHFAIATRNSDQALDLIVFTFYQGYFNVSLISLHFTFFSLVIGGRPDSGASADSGRGCTL
jgi:hypothetical protein